MLRTIFYHLVFIPGTLFFSCLAILIAPPDRSRFLGNWVAYAWGSLSAWAAGVTIETDLSALDAYEQEHGQGPVVYMANHQSHLDIPILCAALWPRRASFVAKKSLFSIPFFGWSLYAMRHYAIDRDNPRASMKLMNRVAEDANKGFSMMVFPEGTRNHRHDTVADFKVGGMIVAIKCGLPVVPLIVCRTGPVLPKGSARIGDLSHEERRVVIKALPPVDVSGMKLKERDQLKERLHAIMAAAYNDLCKERGL